MLYSQIKRYGQKQIFIFHYYYFITQDKEIIPHIRLKWWWQCVIYVNLASPINDVCHRHVRSRQNGRHYPYNIFKCIFLNENCCILIKSSLKCISHGPIDTFPALVQMMIWHRSGVKPLSEKNDGWDLWRIYASLGLNELTGISLVTHASVCIRVNTFARFPDKHRTAQWIKALSKNFWFFGQIHRKVSSDIWNVVMQSYSFLSLQKYQRTSWLSKSQAIRPLCNIFLGLKTKKLSMLAITVPFVIGLLSQHASDMENVVMPWRSYVETHTPANVYFKFKEVHLWKIRHYIRSCELQNV